MRKAPRITVVGSLIFDFVAFADHLPRRGETVMGKSFGMYAGGKGANQAVQASRLGAEVYIVGRVGDDFLGERLLSNLQNSGVNTTYVKRDKSASTASCCIHVDANGNNAIIIAPEANMNVSPGDIDDAKEMLLSADIILCQFEIPMPSIEHTVNLASANSIPIILNPAPARDIPDGLFSRVDIITPNETEAEFFSGVAINEEDLETSIGMNADKLLERGARLVIMTLGKEGAFVAESRQRKHIRGFTVSAIDTTAAGDAFNGALAVALAEGKSVEEAVIFANGAGALATCKAGAQSSLCCRRELEVFLEITNGYRP